MTDIATGSTCNHADIPKNRIVKSDSSVVLVKNDGANIVINPYKTSIYSSMTDSLYSLAWECRDSVANSIRIHDSPTNIGINML